MDDDGDDLCYAVDVCNWFSLLPMEPTTAEESDVDEFLTNFVSRPISRVMESKSVRIRANSDLC